MNQNLLADIQRQMDTFSKGQKLIANYIIDHYEKAAYMTASKLGITVGVSESTVVRFASELGYEGYPQLQKALQELIRNRLTSVQRMEIAEEKMQSSDILKKVLNMDSDRIKRTLEEISPEEFEKAINTINAARKIYIIGIRSSASLASFMSFYFNHIFDNSCQVNTSSSSEMYEQIFRIDSSDVLITLSFPRYSKQTVKAAHCAISKGAKVIAITDSNESPIAKLADITLLARSDMASFVDSLVAPLSLINALIVALGMTRHDIISASYAELEKIWEEYHVYEKTVPSECEADEEN
ncbi:MAG: MurR/RpiR family transcriptional regulator [Oscillospiraceae bacterium]